MRIESRRSLAIIQINSLQLRLILEQCFHNHMFLIAMCSWTTKPDSVVCYLEKVLTTAWSGNHYTTFTWKGNIYNFVIKAYALSLRHKHMHIHMLHIYIYINMCIYMRCLWGLKIYMWDATARSFLKCIARYNPMQGCQLCKAIEAYSFEEYVSGTKRL